MFRLFFIYLILLVNVTGCTTEMPPAPYCRAQQQDTDNYIYAADSSNAGCLIRFEHQTLLITHRFSQRLDIPGGGAQTDESLACTAHRETFEETGLNVEVLFPVAQTKHGMIIFACIADDMININHFPRPSPSFALTESVQVSLYDLFDLEQESFRFEDDLVPFRDAFIATPASTPLSTEAIHH
ncbi:MAG TPA: DNA mismatch repair protein MutT [Glaciecola sp.]|nr:DNA mismatch repair protein MutT [Glaciecola sp.]